MLSLCMNIYLVDHFCIFVGNIFYIYLGHFFSANNKQCSTDNFGNGNIKALMEWHYYLYGVVVCSHSCMIHHYNLNVRLFSFASAIVRICCVSVCVCWFSPSNFFYRFRWCCVFFFTEAEAYINVNEWERDCERQQKSIIEQRHGWFCNVYVHSSSITIVRDRELLAALHITYYITA